MTDLAIELQSFVGAELQPPRHSADGVNEAMIRHWCLAMGDHNPRYAPGPDQVAPPAMLQAWCMRELDPPADGASRTIDELLTRHGYTAVVATNCSQRYDRDLRPGEVPVERRVLELVSDEKRTALGDGFFITAVSTYEVDGEPVATMRFRTLRYRPAAAERPAGRRPRPALNEDNRFFFDGAADGRLLVRRCASCGRDQHPPVPMCPACGSVAWEVRPVAGTGALHTFTVTHHPAFPGFASPFVVAVVDLDDGPRLVTNLVDVDPGDVHIGMPVEVAFVAVDDELTLPLFRPTRAGSGA